MKRVLFYTVVFLLVTLCSSEDTEHSPVVLIASYSDAGGGILRINMGTGSRYSVPSPLKAPIDVDYDPVEQTIYSIEATGIAASPLNKTGTIREKDLPDGSKLKAFAVDPLSKLIFYTDDGNDEIAMMTMANFDKRSVINTDLDRPYGIALDTKNGVLFWTDILTYKIERANYDGTNRVAIITEDVIHANGVAVDAPNNRLYWMDTIACAVEMSDLDGKGRTTLLEPASCGLYWGLSLFQDYIYLSETVINGYGGKIVRLNDRRDATVILESKERDFYGIHVFSPQTTLHSGNGCGNNNGGCAKICIPLPSNESRCLCPDGEVLTSDQRTCAKAFVSTSDPQPLDTNGNQTMTLTCQHVMGMENISYTYVWKVPCVQQSGNKCLFTPQPLKDDGKLIICIVTPSDGQTVVGDMKVELNYPPQDAPAIFGFPDDTGYQVGDAVNMTCSVRGGKPLVTSVLFSCGRHVGRSKNVSGTTEVISTLTIDSLTMEDEKVVCSCKAEWKHPDWYRLTTTRRLRVFDTKSTGTLHKSAFVVTGVVLCAVMVVL